MADAIVSTPATVTLTSSGNSGPVAVTVVSDASAAIQLMDGLLVEGQAQARAAKGLIEVMTANGVLTLKAAPGATLPAIPAGARLTLQMVGQGEAGQLFLVGLNGRPLGGTTLSGAIGGLPNLPGSLNLGGPATMAGAPAGGLPGADRIGDAMLPRQAGPQMVGAGTFNSAALSGLGLTATVIRPATASTMPGSGGPGVPAEATAGLPSDLPAGTRLTVRIAGIEAPAPAGNAAPAPQTATGGSDGAATPTPQPSPSGGKPQAGQAADTRATGSGQPPGQAATPQAGSIPTGGLASSSPLLGGTVIAHPPNGQAVVQTPVATLSVPTQADLPVGTRMTLEVVGSPQPPAPLPSAAPARPEGLTPMGWPALTDALDALANANQPQALDQLLRTIPQPDERLAASMVAFTGALRGGTGRGMVSETTIRGLEKAGRKDVASRLASDLEALTEDSGRPVANGDWRTYTMPMLHGGVVEPVRLFVRKPAGEDGSGKSGGVGNQANDHRFVLDFNLSRLGRLQLDGLVRREDKLFDLIIRTGQAVDSDMRRDILAIFNDASELVGTKGTVTFQSGGRWLEFPPTPPAPTRIEA